MEEEEVSSLKGGSLNYRTVSPTLRVEYTFSPQISSLGMFVCSLQQLGGRVEHVL